MWRRGIHTPSDHTMYTCSHSNSLRLLLDKAAGSSAGRFCVGRCTERRAGSGGTGAASAFPRTGWAVDPARRRDRPVGVRASGTGGRVAEDGLARAVSLAGRLAGSIRSGRAVDWRRGPVERGCGPAGFAGRSGGDPSAIWPVPAPSATVGGGPFRGRRKVCLPGGGGRCLGRRTRPPAATISGDEGRHRSGNRHFGRGHQRPADRPGRFGDGAGPGGFPQRLAGTRPACHRLSFAAGSHQHRALVCLGTNRTGVSVGQRPPPNGRRPPSAGQIAGTAAAGSNGDRVGLSPCDAMAVSWAQTISCTMGGCGVRSAFVGRHGAS